jgi:hypothetical protein
MAIESFQRTVAIAQHYPTWQLTKLSLRLQRRENPQNLILILYSSQERHVTYAKLIDF